MKEISILIGTDESNDITVTNMANNIIRKIDGNTKTIVATDIYEVLNYNIGDEFEVTSNIENVNDEQKKRYLSEVLDIFKIITIEISKIDIKNKADLEKETFDYDAE